MPTGRSNRGATHVFAREALHIQLPHRRGGEGVMMSLAHGRRQHASAHDDLYARMSDAQTDPEVRNCCDIPRKSLLADDEHLAELRRITKGIRRRRTEETGSNSISK